jgi:hypothetical protein
MHTANGTAHTTKDCHVVLTESAVEAHREALTAIQAAHVWAENLTNLREDEAMDESTLYARRELVAKMRSSYFENLVTLITMGQGFDGGLTFWRDGEACMYWKHAKSDYCGGLILHRNHRYSSPGEPIPVGEWSTHT